MKMAIALPPAEERTVLYGVSWQTYEDLLADHQDRSAPRFTYDRGTLEIMSPLPEHEECNRAIALLVEVIAEEWNLDLRNLGSTTFRREDLARGFEPDSCFYLRNARLIEGKRQLDLTLDPPPDLVIEIDITHSSLDKLSLYEALRVPEIWRYDGGSLRILSLGEEGYRECEESIALPGVTSSILTDWVKQSRLLQRRDWLRRVRAWAREQARADAESG
jgi:Uma2 family endonuclease